MKPTGGRPLISLRGIEKKYGLKKCIDSLDLDIRAGEFISLFGPNGAGKTTLLKILSGLQGISSGAVETLPGALERSGIGYISHKVMLYPELTGRENLEFFAELYNLPDPGGRAGIMISRVGLEADADRFVRDYSRGMMQRLSLGRFLINDPLLMLLDEPFTGLDSRGSEFLSTLLSSSRREGRTVVLVTHDLEKGYGLADRLVAMAGGRIFMDVPAAEISFTEFAARYERGGR